MVDENAVKPVSQNAQANKVQPMPTANNNLTQTDEVPKKLDENTIKNGVDQTKIKQNQTSLASGGQMNTPGFSLVSGSTLASKNDKNPSIDFDQRFPTLMQVLENYSETVELNKVKKQIIWADDDVADSLINEFYTKKTVSVLDSVNVELTAVLGQSWTTFCQQSQGRWAGHTLLVLSLMLEDELYLALKPKQQNILKWACLLH